MEHGSVEYVTRLLQQQFIKKEKLIAVKVAWLVITKLDLKVA